MTNANEERMAVADAATGDVKLQFILIAGIVTASIKNPETGEDELEQDHIEAIYSVPADQIINGRVIEAGKTALGQRYINSAKEAGMDLVKLEYSTITSFTLLAQCTGKEFFS